MLTNSDLLDFIVIHSFAFKQHVCDGFRLCVVNVRFASHFFIDKLIKDTAAHQHFDKVTRNSFAPHGSHQMHYVICIVNTTLFFCTHSTLSTWV